jgi:mycoredoxin
MLQDHFKSVRMTFVRPDHQESCEAHRTMNDLYTSTPTQIVMYATEYCSDCVRAKKFFETNKIPHLRVGLEGNSEATEFVLKINKGYRSVPTIVFPDGSILVEPDWEELKAKFSNS